MEKTTTTTAAPPRKQSRSAQTTTRRLIAPAVAAVVLLFAVAAGGASAAPRRIVVDTDMDTDDVLALLYILKQDRSEFDVKAITINANEWSDAGHAADHLYDILHMMGRDDIPVGVGGDGGISDAGVVHPDVGGYLPLIDQGTSTIGGCRYRQAVPPGRGGRLDVDTNSGLRRELLPRGPRGYRPLRQPTAQQVMTAALAAGPATVLLLGAHTNLALFLLAASPRLRRNVERVYVSGGAVRAPGNLFTARAANPFADFNIFGDPFAAHVVLHSGVPVTMVPLDVTTTIPVTEAFIDELRRRQGTHEARYCFRSIDAVLARLRRRSSGSGGHGNTASPTPFFDGLQPPIDHCKTLHSTDLHESLFTLLVVAQGVSRIPSRLEAKHHTNYEERGSRCSLFNVNCNVLAHFVIEPLGRYI